MSGLMCVLFVVLVIVFAAMQKPKVNTAIECRQCHVTGQVKTTKMRHKGLSIERATCGNCNSVYTL